MAPEVQEGSVLLPEVTFPDFLALPVDGDDLSVAEPRVDELAVGHRSRGGEIVLLVRIGSIAGGGGAVSPEAAAVRSLEGFHGEVKFAVRAAGAADGVLATGEIAVVAREAGVVSAGVVVTADLGGDDDHFARDDRGGRACSGEEALQAMFFVGLHCVGRPVSAEIPWPAGPRHWGQSPAAGRTSRKSRTAPIPERWVVTSPVYRRQ